MRDPVSTAAQMDWADSTRSVSHSLARSASLSLALLIVFSLIPAGCCHDSLASLLPSLPLSTFGFPAAAPAPLRAPTRTRRCPRPLAC